MWVDVFTAQVPEDHEDLHQEVQQVYDYYSPIL